MEATDGLAADEVAFNNVREVYLNMAIIELMYE